MLRPIRILMLFSAMFMLALVGCSSESSSSKTPDEKSTTTTAADHDAEDANNDDQDHGHDHGTDDSDHSHAGQTTDDDDDDHGSDPPQTVVTIDGVTLDVTCTGSFTPGSVVDFFVQVTDGPAPTTLRIWLGDQSGEGSLKTRADGHDDHFHGHFEVPKSVSESAALWIEIESESGERTSGSLPLP